MNLAVVFGGTSREREVSINTGKSVLNALKSQDNIFPIDFKGNYDLLFPTYHIIFYDEINKKK